jgi:hypothetical protein
MGQRRVDPDQMTASQHFAKHQAILKKGGVANPRLEAQL